MSIAAATRRLSLDATQARLLALDYVSEAFAEAVLDGVEAEAFAEAAMAAALRELVAQHGEERVAEIVAAWPERVRSGEYSSRLRQ